MAEIKRVFTDAETIENEVYSFDFIRDVNATEFLLSATFTLSLIDGGLDPSPASHLIGGAAISANTSDGRNTVAAQRIAGLVAGCRYRVSCQPTTNLGNTPNLYSHVTCRAQN